MEDEDLTLPRFSRRILVYWARMIRYAVVGSRGFYLWMGSLALWSGWSSSAGTTTSPTA